MDSNTKSSVMAYMHDACKTVNDSKNATHTCVMKEESSVKTYTKEHTIDPVDR